MEKSLQTMAINIVADFIKFYRKHAKEVIAEIPEFQIWMTDRAPLFFEECLQVNVSSKEDLKHLILMLKYVKYSISSCENIEEKWFWIVEALAQTRRFMRNSGYVTVKSKID